MKNPIGDEILINKELGGLKENQAPALGKQKRERFFLGETFKKRYLIHLETRGLESLCKPGEDFKWACAFDLEQVTCEMCLTLINKSADSESGADTGEKTRLDV